MSLTPYTFPSDSCRLGNLCDQCNRADATMRETTTDGIYCSETCAHRHYAKLTPAFSAVAREALSVGWPTAYRRDLTLWDRRYLAELPPDAPVLWFLRDYGTHVVSATSGDGLTSNGHAATAIDLVRSIVSTWGPERTRCYLWDGRALTSITPAEAHQTAQRWTRELAKKAA